MIPIIMNENELKLIIYGKKIEGKHIRGLVDVEREVRESFKAKPAPYKIGTMVELPAAALGADQLARYAQFFSFGTNDLTQTTIGLSRDDFNAFMPDYTQFDLLEGNPFQIPQPAGARADRAGGEEGQDDTARTSRWVSAGSTAPSRTTSASAWRRGWTTCPARPTRCRSRSWPLRRSDREEGRKVDVRKGKKRPGIPAVFLCARLVPRRLCLRFTCSRS